MGSLYWFETMDNGWERRLKQRIGKGMGIALLLGFIVINCIFFPEISGEDIQHFVSRQGVWGPLVYMGLFAVLPAAFFPVAVLALGGGLAFGLLWGSVYTFIGALVNCALMFLLSRYVGRERISAYVQKRLPPKWQARLADAGGPQGFLLLILLRLIPAVPYNLINYAFGLTDISFGAYMLASGLGIIPGTFVFINIGDKAQQTASPAFWIALGLLGALCILTALLGRRLFPETGKMDKQKGMDASHGTKNK